MAGLNGKTDPDAGTHEGHPEVGYRTEDIRKEMKKHAGDVDTLIDLLRSGSQLDREKAADYLGEIGDPKAVQPLIEALGDSSINWIAAESLGKLGDARAVRPLIAALGSDQKWVRRNAATALGLIGDPSAEEALIHLLADSRHDVRQAAATALGMVGGEPSIAALGLLATDPDERVRQAAAASLVVLKQKKN